jgi:hypothetical protein
MSNIERVLVSSLGLGDIVQLFSDAYGYGTVTQVKGDSVTVQRPHVVLADFSYTGGVLWSIGIETVNLWGGGTGTVALVRKGSPLR